MPLKPLEVMKYVRKELIVDAVLVTEENMELVAQWCGGEIGMTEDKRFYIQIEDPRARHINHTRAFVGRFIVFAGESYKVFTLKNLERTFRPAVDSPKIVEVEALEYDENTLFKVNNALMAVGLSERDAHVAIQNMQNAGILFRERPSDSRKRHVPGDVKIVQDPLFDEDGNLVPTDQNGRPYMTIDDYEIQRAQEAGTSTLLNENLAPSIAGNIYPHGD